MRLACEQSQSQSIKSLNDFWESSRLMFCETLYRGVRRNSVRRMTQHFS